MKLFFTVFFSLSITFTSFGQSTDSLTTAFKYKNNVHFEAFGNGIIYSFNYERILINNQKFKTAIGIGFEYLPPGAGIDLSFPIQINEIVSFKKHHLEFGVGYTSFLELWHEEKSDLASGLFFGRIGYRYQKPEGRFNFRIGFSPTFFEHDAWGGVEYFFTPWGGFSFGYAFGK